MLNEDQTDNSDKAVFTALAVGGFVWLVFDSFIFALIAAFIAFTLINQKQTSTDETQEDN